MVLGRELAVGHIPRGRHRIPNSFAGVFSPHSPPVIVAPLCVALDPRVIAAPERAGRGPPRVGNEVGGTLALGHEFILRLTDLVSKPVVNFDGTVRVARADDTVAAIT